jgi:hypothetical protein
VPLEVGSHRPRPVSDLSNTVSQLRIFNQFLHIAQPVGPFAVVFARQRLTRPVVFVVPTSSITKTSGLIRIAATAIATASISQSAFALRFPGIRVGGIALLLLRVAISILRSLLFAFATSAALLLA